MTEKIEPFSFSLPAVLIKEVDDVVKASNKYRNRSHFAQTAFEKLMAEEARAGGA
jgi:metal-responsive CopG/Arc/MetJ family transcriptional regulator